jgi:hypothetical protein
MRHEILVLSVALLGCSAPASPGETGKDHEDEALTLNGFDDIDDKLPWSTCGSCANSGATGATAFTSFKPGAISVDGTGVKNEVGEGIAGANHPPYGDAYWWKEHGPRSGLVRAIDYYLHVYVPSKNDAGNPTDPQAIEFEVQQTIHDTVYNFAWQNNYAGNEWRVFQYGGSGNGKWISSGITGAAMGGTTRFTTNTWHTIHARFTVDTSTSPDTIRHDYLEVDGHRHTPTVNVHAWHSSTARADQFSNAVQLDMRGVPCTKGSSPSCQQGSDGVYRVGVPYHVYWDEIHMTYAYSL